MGFSTVHDGPPGIGEGRQAAARTIRDRVDGQLADRTDAVQQSPRTGYYQYGGRGDSSGLDYLPEALRFHLSGAGS